MHLRPLAIERPETRSGYDESAVAVIDGRRPLTDPTAYRGRLEDAFDVVIPRCPVMASDITAPTITFEGDVNGAPHPEAGIYAKKFSADMRTESSLVASGKICLRKPCQPQAPAQSLSRRHCHLLQ
jgi:hypothetical protein